MTSSIVKAGSLSMRKGSKKGTRQNRKHREENNELEKIEPFREDFALILGKSVCFFKDFIKNLL